MIKYNVGSGKRFFGEDWQHVDGAYFPHIIDTDVTLKYQPNDYIDLLYSSHLIAYFDREEIKELLASWYKKIKPGGTLRIATPDFGIMSEMYQHRNLPIELFLGPIYGKMPMGEQTIHHKTMYDLTSLTNVLNEAGFIDVEEYDHRRTVEHPNTGNRNDFYDDHSASHIDGTLISLNVQAKKPL